MKRLAFSALLIVATLASGTAQAARQPKVYTHYQSLKFEKEPTSPYTMNLMDDGINLPEGYDEIRNGVKFVLNAGETFRIAIKAIDGDNQTICRHSQPVRRHLRDGRTLITFNFTVHIEIDDGSACHYLVQLNNGKRALVHVYAEGM
ncbi:MAG: hypothetical protein NDI61_00735 [Bdellovibrionaceae bacterium]|nr:hypothetical protein [Pseudobdellovibrionaceae bacterium]